MGRSLFTGGTVVTAEGSFRADVLVEDEKIVAIGADLPANGAETVDATGRLVMPGFIDAHTLYRDGEVVGERGSGRFIERSFAAPSLEVRA